MEQQKKRIRELSKIRMRKRRALRHSAVEGGKDVRIVNAESNEVMLSLDSDENQLDVELECDYGTEGGDTRSDEEKIEGYETDESGDDREVSESGSDFGMQTSSNSEGNETSAEEGTNDEPLEIKKIRKWAIQNKIQHTQLDSLLAILRPRLLPGLPKSAKTFLRTTSAKYVIEKCTDSNGQDTAEFVYFGIATGLRSYVNVKLHDEGEKLNLQINIDGLPLSKSSSKQFWPILCRVHSSSDLYDPFPLAVYAGNGKPGNADQYLGKFIEEINELQESGIFIDEKQFQVNIMCFVCDKPARSFIKCVKGHVGYYACERCTVKGERVKQRMVYTDIQCSERTDTSFRHKENSEHHTGTSPLMRIHPQIDMIFCFVLDIMHLLYLGIMKKLLIDCWLGGANLSIKLSVRNRHKVSERLMALKFQIPCEFQRTTRSLENISKWKATEFHFFLHYCGPIVLQDILPRNLYKHFLLLHVACRILCTKNLSLQYNAEAKIYLRSFVAAARHYYGPQIQVLNMHSLIHLADDVKNMKCSLNEVTAFPFENLLGRIKKLLRSGNPPLAQLCRRFSETFHADKEKVNLPPTVTISKKGPHTGANGNIPVKRLQFKESIITTKVPDNTVMFQDGRILEIDAMYLPPNEDVNNVEIVGCQWKIKGPLYKYPCSSNSLKQWEIKKNPERRVRCSLQLISMKMIRFGFDDGQAEKKRIYVMPLLHS